MKTIIFGMLFFVISVYGYTHTRSIIKGVEISADVVKKSEGSTLSRVVGQARNAKFITLNGREIFVDKKGNFAEDIAFPNGFSVITLFAQDTSGKNSEKTFEIYTKNGESLAISNSEKNIINN